MMIPRLLQENKQSLVEQDNSDEKQVEFPQLNFSSNEPTLALELSSCLLSLNVP